MMLTTYPDGRHDHFSGCFRTTVVLSELMIFAKNGCHVSGTITGYLPAETFSFLPEKVHAESPPVILRMNSNVSIPFFRQGHANVPRPPFN